MSASRYQGGRNGARIPNVEVMSLLQDMLPRLGRAQRCIARAVPDDPEYFVSQSVSVLAQRCGVSTGSIAKFCKRLDLKGISALKITIARELGEPSIIPEESCPPTDGVPSILTSVLERHIENLRQTFKFNSTDSLDSAVNHLLKAQPIFIFSTGLSFPMS